MSSILSLMHKSRVPFAIHCPLTQLYIIYHSELALSNPFLDLVYSYLIYTTLPYSTLPYPTLPYPTLPYLTLPYSTLHYPTRSEEHTSELQSRP